MPVVLCIPLHRVHNLEFVGLMFAPVVLPLTITCCVMLAVSACMLIALRRQGVTPSRSICWVLGAIVVSFVPTCIVVGWIADLIRYGEFFFATASEIKDPYVNIPEAATAITLHKYASGHELRFTVDQDALQAWMDAVVNKRRRFVDATPFILDDADVETRRTEFEHHFKRHDWDAPADVICYRGWHSLRGAGFDVWYSPANEVAYLSVAYW